MPKTILIIAAHPDDEVLGCAGTIARFVRNGSTVHVIYLTDGVGARRQGVSAPNVELLARREAAKIATNILGVSSIDFGSFPDNRMDSLDLLDIVRYIEDKINDYSPEMVITHHAGDLNIDHRLVNQATVTACRPQPGHLVKTLLFFEIPSSTEWQISSVATTFVPNWFVDITSYVELRIQAIEAYTEEMRPWPHSRSLEAMEHLIRWRGASVGVEAAEAFMLGRTLLVEK